MDLSDSEKKTLLKFEKVVKKTHLIFIIVGISFCVVILNLIIGIKYQSKAALLFSFVIFCWSVQLFFDARRYQRLYSIIEKMKIYINELEKDK